MNATRSTTRHPHIAVAIMLAQLLEKLDRSPVAADPGQYRLVAQRLADALAAAPPGGPLEALLGASPAAAEVYENLNYRHAGLCRSPLDDALGAELRTHEALSRAGAAAPADPAR